MKKILCIMLCLSMVPIYSNHSHTRLWRHACDGMDTPEDRSTFGKFIMGGLSTVFKDALELNRNLVSLDSIKVLAGFTPLYISTRFIDERVQKRFYDPDNHKNINQMPSTFCRVVEDGAFGIMVGLSTLTFFGQTEHARTTGRVFGVGAVSALLGKKIVKEFKFQGGKRPWHEKFSKKKRSDGGFPSGHMVEAAYSATVFGWQYGYKAGIPLGIYAGLMFGVSVNRNRHYVSQVVAGSAVGVMYGLAANRLIDKRLCKDLSINVGSAPNGSSELTVAYKF